LKNNAIIIILLLFLAVTSFFWFQSMRVKDLPPGETASTTAISGKDAEQFIRRAEELLTGYKTPLPTAYGKDPLFDEEPEEQTELVQIDPSKIFVLSSIIYSDSHPLAVVNGEIMAEGDTLYDTESGTKFMIENIEADKVEVASDKRKYTLAKARQSAER
jgi:hypothetical protein